METGATCCCFHQHHFSRGLMMKGWYYRLMADARWIVAFLVLWSVLFIGVYLPFDRRIEQMDQPLERAWERLSQSIQTNRLGSLLAFDRLDQLAENMDQSFSSFMDSEAELISRILLTESDQRKLESGFQLVEYENAVANLKEHLRREAKDQKVTLAPAVLDGMPEPVIETEKPSLLWVDYAFAKHLLALAIACRPNEIHAFQTLTSIDGPVPERGLRTSQFRLQLTGDMAAIQQLLRTLPMRGSEAQAIGLPSPYWEKPALFVGGLMIEKTGPTPDDQVRLNLLAEGFHYIHTKNP